MVSNVLLKAKEWDRIFNESEKFVSPKVLLSERIFIVENTVHVENPHLLFGSEYLIRGLEFKGYSVELKQSPDGFTVKCRTSRGANRVHGFIYDRYSSISSNGGGDDVFDPPLQTDINKDQPWT